MPTIVELNMRFQLHIKAKILKNKDFFLLNDSDVVFIPPIKVKMSTIIGILTFMSRLNFMLS